MDHSALPDLSLLASLPPSAQRLYACTSPWPSSARSFTSLPATTASEPFPWSTASTPLQPRGFQPTMDQDDLEEDGRKEYFNWCLFFSGEDT
ncbi:hypothetical protein GUJ93_ZPchr0006g46188 [Zizania palustris]|uniref:Uncharacterized protein n=1 Tax=Zizania palustris TaxID=103762 RepID=A0A8J5T932_ZIZPA|nr:hypothetical protein GUJ93_ZPchr0006g46188 [Zizania palustris]